MYNRGRYNLAMRRMDDVHIVIPFRERITGWLGMGANYQEAPRIHEAIHGRSRLSAGVGGRIHSVERLTGTIIATTGIQISHGMEEELAGALQMGGDIYLPSTLAEEALQGTAHMGADVYLLQVMESALTGSLFLSANIYINDTLYEILNGYADVYHLASYTTAISGSIPPGQSLVIDAENFNVLLGNKNVIEWHSGDWLKIGRRTASLTMSGIGSKQFEWEVFYLARYL